MASSCSNKFSGSTRSFEIETPIDIVADERQVLSVEKSVGHEDESWGSVVERAEKGENANVNLGRIDFEALELKDISNFTTGELTHISTCNYDPFKGSDEIFIDTDALKHQFTYPVDGQVLSNYGRRNGRFHSGVDIKAGLGDKIYAALPGVVRMSKYYAAYGNVVVIRHACGIETAYSHNSKNLVNVGDYVAKGDVVALAGRTGRATGTHLHFEVRVKGKAINPNYLIDTSNHSLQKDNLYIYLVGSQISVLKYPRDKKEVKSESKSFKKEDSKVENREQTIHIIKSGDTLLKVAKKYGTTVLKLCQANGLKSTTTLRIGQKIVIK